MPHCAVISKSKKMIFQISPKLSVAIDLPQTCQQTVPQTRPCNSEASVTKSVGPYTYNNNSLSHRTAMI